ncbi:GNAT family N-acetyltransferase [Streptomyces sp. NPDC059566]|uniref:GNAT family N-acetyltransferase n=1 Tax=Streptomyces sp. NPDC059566 TaxID=3346866 RepID=UPI0036C770E9
MPCQPPVPGESGTPHPARPPTSKPSRNGRRPTGTTHRATSTGRVTRGRFRRPTSGTTRSSSWRRTARASASTVSPRRTATCSWNKLFVDADEIGKGYGKALWQHAIRTAGGLGRSEFTIASDPNAAPFYAAMGAEEYATKPTAEPSWTLHMFRYTLSSLQVSGISSSGEA